MIRRWRGDRRASVTVLFAILSAIFFAVAAIALDLVTLWTARRNAQGAADLAAILAASRPDNRDAAARRALADNGFAKEAPKATVNLGAYTSSAAVSPLNRFTAGAAPLNAVRVAFETTVTTTFSKIVGLPSVFTIPAAATAQTADYASFTVGSGLASLNGGMANALLGALLGTNVSLSVADYNALATAKVDAFRYLDALATQVNLTGVDYERILDANITLGNALAALSASLPGGTATQVIQSLLNAPIPVTAKLPVSSLVDIGDIQLPSRGTQIAGPTLSALATLTNAAALANGTNQVSVDLGPSIPGLASTRVVVAIGQRKQSSGIVQVGSSKSTLRTNQIKALVEARLTLPLASVRLPIYIEAARATATLATVTCPWSDSSRREVAVDVRPGVVDLAIANVSAAAVDLSRPTPPLSEAALLLTVPLLSATGSARVTWDAPYTQRLVFNDADITQGRIRSASSTQAVGGIASSLVQKLRIDINGIDLTGILGLQNTLRPAIEAVAPPLDGVIDTLLRMLGIRLGFADVSVDGMRCGRGVLVQ